MHPLSKVHRKLLEKATADARTRSESACRAALENLAVHEKEYRPHMVVEQRLLRNRLRAQGRALGDARDPRTGAQDIRRLCEHAAYEHWHRLLFTRFLTENHLLRTDEANGAVPVTLEECEELAPDMGARDGFNLACRFASLILPGVFRRDDPVLDLPIALNDQVELRKLLATLPPETFRADDALGWHPDLDDGVRQNIRPFLLAGDVGKKGAGLFRAVPLSLKDKDRGAEPRRPKADYPWFWCTEEPGTDPAGGEKPVGNRWNDVHLTLAARPARSTLQPRSTAPHSKAWWPSACAPGATTRTAAIACSTGRRARSWKSISWSIPIPVMTILASILQSLRNAAAYNRHELAAPRVILWPDEEQLWTTCP